MNTFRLEIITPEKEFLSEDVESSEIPGASGEFEILYGHTPFLTPLEPGIVTYITNGRYKYVSISGGFCEVKPERTVILAPAAEFPHEIDKERASSARDRAKQLMASPDESIDKKRARKALNRALARLRAAELK